MLKLINDAIMADTMLHYASLIVHKEHPVFCEFGVAYGGNLERISRIIPHGTLHGFDTFEGHPKEHYKDMSGVDTRQLNCMDRVYKIHGPPTTKECMNKYFNDNNINNVHLHKGLINDKSLNNIKEIDFALLDLDIVEPMRQVLKMVHPHISVGGFIALHDVGTFDSEDWYRFVCKPDEYVVSYPLKNALVVLEKVK